jgi:transglutaminase-like putative cysteine protease
MRATSEQSLKPGLQLQLYLLTGLVLLPHAAHMPILVSLFLFAALAWRLLSLKFPRLQPGRWLLVATTLTGVFLIYSQHQTLIGRDAGVSLLSVMLVLKTLEVRKRRDLTVTVYIAYFIIVTQFLFNQSFLLLVYLLVMLVGHTSLLMSIQRVTPPRSPLETYKRTFWITLQAVPIALILFVLFPRLTHPLWHFGLDASATTGLSDRVSPGTISQLIQSSEVVFRVKFDDAVPAPEQRYWRALVLWDTDGFSWFTDEDQPFDQQMPRLLSTSEAVSYRVFLEPHRKRWLYALDLPLTAHSGAELTGDYLLRSKQRVIRALQYEGLSSTGYRLVGLSAEKRQRALKLGEGITLRQRNLASSWQQNGNEAAAVVQQALDYFHDNPFVYTLNPPTYRANPVEQFLFDSREGFCEHYASAFTQLMRLAGIPARMVVGFQGGEFNRLGDYYTIRNSDAHAWSEVWIEQRGWVRIDPTASVAPERVRSTIRTGLGSIGEPVRFIGQQDGFFAVNLRNVRMLLDAMEVNWERWILGYNREQQFGLMQLFGFQFMRHGGWVLLVLGLVFSVLGLITLRLLMQGRIKQGQTVRLYQKFCRRMAGIGLPRIAREGPLEYSRRTSQERPDLAPQIREITKLYIGLRYGPRQTRPQQHALMDRVRHFRPGRLRRAG